MGHEGKKVLLPILEKSIAHNNVEEFCKTLKLSLNFFFSKIAANFNACFIQIII